jgi:hypothetical protein
MFLEIAYRFQILTNCNTNASFRQENSNMTQNVIFLHGQPSAIGHFVRVGSTGHRQIENLLGAGRMPMESVVIEAGVATRQAELIGLLKESGRELILDTNVAELSSIGKFDGHVKSAPWADPEGPLTPDHFSRGPNYDLVGKIARFAVQYRFDVVHTPTHMLESSISPRLAIDREACLALRRALDSEGGREIAIDYPLITSFASLRDPIQRRTFMEAMNNLPVDNFWFRISGFGADATAMGIRRYIAALSEFLRLNKPIVADGIGGLAGLAIVAFGAAAGVAHGVAERERFDATDWDKPRSLGGGGNARRVLVPGLDRLLTMKQMETLMTAQGGRRICSCSDRSCCPHGWDDTQRDPKGHYLFQRTKQIRALSAVSDLRRIEHFLSRDLADANQTARRAARIRTSDESIREMLLRSSERIERISAVLEELKRTMGDGPRSAPVHRSTQRRGAARRRH